MAPLDRALALAERDRAAVPVAEQLDLDVSRALEVPLAEHGVVAERGLRLAARRLDRAVELRGGADDSHPAPAPARGGLDENGEAERRRVALVEDRHARLARDAPGGELVAARAQGLRRWADEDQARRLDRLCEVGVLGEEAVPGWTASAPEALAARMCSSEWR